MLPPSFLRPFSSFGVGGARSGGSPFCLPAAVALLEQVAACGGSVLTSCCSGVPAFTVMRFPTAQVFRASDLSSLPRPAALAARAVALVRAVAAAPASLWICFPGVECPPIAAVSLSRSWSASGSGSWSECRLAAGLGVPVLVFLPSGIYPPLAWGAWSSLAASPGGLWWFLPSPPSLFN